MARPKVSVSDVSDKLWTKVLCYPPSRCWWMVHSLTWHGYGSLRVGGKNSRKVQAHRLAYELLVGPIPPGMDLHHTCSNRACVFPGHLRVATRAEHRRLHTLERCRRGHDAYYTTPGGVHRCRICESANLQRFRGRTIKVADAKLTDEFVRRIRALPRRRGLAAELARESGIGYQTIWDALNGRNYRHVT